MAASHRGRRRQLCVVLGGWAGGNELSGGEGGAPMVRSSGSDTQLLAARVSTWLGLGEGTRL
jgi:truncated hemoglobin YjbI